MPIEANKSEEMNSREMWHRRLGHPSKQIFCYLPDVSSNNNPVGLCDACFKAKLTQDVFQESSNKADDCLSLIHCDFWEAYRVPTSCGAVYFLTIVDDCSRAVWVYLLLGKKLQCHRLLRISIS